MRARLHRGARQELAEAALYLDEARTGYGDRFVVAFAKARDFLLQYPNSGRLAGDGTRRMALTGFRYNVVYVVRDDVLFIVAIAHYRRRPGYWRSRLR